MSRAHPASAAPVPAVDLPVTLGEIVIIGGGCYGTFYARQLQQARLKGKAEFERVIVVDRDPGCQMARELGQSDDRHLVVQDWSDFLDDYLRPAAPLPLRPSQIVPSPLMPHLMYQWLVRRAVARWPGRVVETRGLSQGPGTPYDVSAPDHTRYVSFADWICPTHCIEPAICPVIRGPRTWEMADALSELTARLNRDSPTVGPVLFQCEHQVFAVGTFGVDAVLAGDAVVALAGRAGGSVDIMVGTISSCHGAVNLLHLGPDL